MKVREVMKRLEEDGWLLARTKGSHRQYHHPTEGGNRYCSGSSISGHSARNIEQYLEAGRSEMKYLVIYEKSATGWGAYAPDLPGLGVAAETLDEVKDLIREAVEFHLEGMRQNGDAIPAPSATTEYITV
jgi:predicted RNase H-like HicB family nuclease/predicted RNA binding protein YcfA (HicA-like mRNA interferase family)